MPPPSSRDEVPVNTAVPKDEWMEILDDIHAIKRRMVTTGKADVELLRNLQDLEASIMSKQSSTASPPPPSSTSQIVHAPHQMMYPQMQMPMNMMPQYMPYPAPSPSPYIPSSTDHQLSMIQRLLTEQAVENERLRAMIQVDYISRRTPSRRSYDMYDEPPPPPPRHYDRDYRARELEREDYERRERDYERREHDRNRDRYRRDDDDVPPRPTRTDDAVKSPKKLDNRNIKDDDDDDIVTELKITQNPEDSKSKDLESDPGPSKAMPRGAARGRGAFARTTRGGDKTKDKEPSESTSGPVPDVMDVDDKPTEKSNEKVGGKRAIRSFRTTITRLAPTSAGESVADGSPSDGALNPPRPPFIHIPEPDDPVFPAMNNSDGIEINIDYARFLPENVCACLVIARVINIKAELVSTRSCWLSSVDLNSTPAFPLFAFRTTLNMPKFPVTSLLVVSVLGLEQHSQCLELVGHAVHKLFVEKDVDDDGNTTAVASTGNEESSAVDGDGDGDGDKKDPEDSIPPTEKKSKNKGLMGAAALLMAQRVRQKKKKRAVCLRQGSYQYSLVGQCPPFITILEMHSGLATTDLLNNYPRIPCASICIRVNHMTGQTVSARPVAPYSSREYISAAAMPTQLETELFERRIVNTSVTSKTNQNVILKKMIGDYDDDEMIKQLQHKIIADISPDTDDYCTALLNYVDNLTLLDPAYMVSYDPNVGFNFAVDGVTNYPKAGWLRCFWSLVPPAVLYSPEDLTASIDFTDKISKTSNASEVLMTQAYEWGSLMKKMAFADGFSNYKEIPPFANMFIVIELCSVVHPGVHRKEKVECSGWSVIPVFDTSSDDVDLVDRPASEPPPSEAKTKTKSKDKANKSKKKTDKKIKKTKDIIDVEYEAQESKPNDDDDDGDDPETPKDVRSATESSVKFERHFVSSGAYILPIFKGRPTAEILRNLMQGSFLETLESMVSKKTIKRVEWASLRVRLCDAQMSGWFGIKEHSDVSYLDPAKRTKYILIEPSRPILSMLTKNADPVKMDETLCSAAGGYIRSLYSK